MILSRAWALLLSVCLAAPGEGALPILPPEAPFSAASHPLTRAQQALLAKNKFKVGSDGSVAAPDGHTVAEAEMPYVLTRLGSAQRLKAFVELDILLTNSDGERHLTPAERDHLRKIVRENWPFFSLTTRKDFRNYFSVQELEELNQDPPVSDADDAPFSGMKDPEPAPPPPEPAAPAPPPVAVASYFPAVLQPLSRPAPRAAAPSLPPSPAAAAPLVAAPPPPAAVPPPQVAIAAAPVSIPAPVPAPKAEPPTAPAPRIETAPAPVPVPKQEAPAPPVVKQEPPTPVPASKTEAPANPTAFVVPNAASPKVEQAPGVAALLGKAPAAPAPAVKPLLPTVSAAPSKPRTISPADFEKFLVEAPYGRDEKALLRIVSEKAPDFARHRALAVAMDLMPQIVFDSLRAGFERRAAVLAYETPTERSYTIALNPHAALYTRKRMFVGSTTGVLPDAPRAYTSMHLPAPALEALKRDAVAVKQANGEWGATKQFSDESERAAYTPQEMAGEVLRALLLLDARRQGWGLSPYAAEVYARTAQMMLYAKLFAELREDAFLDPDLRAELRLWLDHPWEYRDFLVHTLSSGRVGTLDPRKGGPEAHADFAKAAQAACPGSDDEDLAIRTAAERDANAKAAVVLARLGLADDKQLESAQAEIASQPALPRPAAERCAQRWLDESLGARQAAALKNQLELAERKFREERGDGTP